MTIEQIIRWFTDTNGYEFAEQIYGKTEDDFHNDGYVAGKFRLMQTQPITWMASLDPQNRARLEQVIKETK
jgi:hypothetical protein|tara:strand:+ start:230 stop:442 length:213 start_codon:yes stop_codon:yes gene_type:complete